MTTAREEILRSIRAALPRDALAIEASYAAIDRAYQREGQLDRRACIDLFVDRLIDYNAEVIEVQRETELSQAIAQVLQHAGEERLIVPSLFPESWLPNDFAIMRDEALSSDEIDRAQAVLTECEVAIASTGTIILIHGGAQGRRVLTLLPDHHICLVRRDQVLELVPEAIARIAPQSTRPITTISGPSATSDIEMTRIRGVHGPRRLTVILYGDAAL